MSEEKEGLKGFQRRYLRGLAHNLDPVVQVGQNGITPAVITAVKTALLDHELIKVKMEQPLDKKKMAAGLATSSGAELCGLVGHVALLYKRHPKEPKIVLPKKSKK
ncbi:MAG: YhbY family RNA-binding protein [Deltaproteobacteria bacterium]|nr:YhbY family RNA-binding protein [Deltaproteobacteria bacterium]